MFKDAAHSKFFNRNGFVSFPLLNKAEIEQAREVFENFEQTHHTSTEKFKGTGWIQEPAVVDRINNSLNTILAPCFKKHFADYQTLGFGFLLKEHGQDSAVSLHQDWTYVDERRFFSMNVWIALEDTDIHNGCLFFIPGSQNLNQYLRPAPTYPVPYKGIENYMRANRVDMPLKAGECVCFNNRTIHGSHPNMSNTYRLAAVSTLYPLGADLLHHYVHNTAKPELITEYTIDKAAFMTLERGLAPATYSKQQERITSFTPVSKIQYWLQLQKTRFLNLINL